MRLVRLKPQGPGPDRGRTARYVRGARSRLSLRARKDHDPALRQHQPSMTLPPNNLPLKIAAIDLHCNEMLLYC